MIGVGEGGAIRAVLPHPMEKRVIVAIAMTGLCKRLLWMI
jgi:hypothetical protein